MERRGKSVIECSVIECGAIEHAVNKKYEQDVSSENVRVVVHNRAPNGYVTRADQIKAPTVVALLESFLRLCYFYKSHCKSEKGAILSIKRNTWGS